MSKECSDIRDELKRLRPNFEMGLFEIPGLPEPLQSDLFIENLFMSTAHRILEDANLKGFLINLGPDGGCLYLPAPKIDFVIPILSFPAHLLGNLEDQLSSNNLTAKGMQSKIFNFCLVVELSAQTNQKKLSCIEFKGSDKYSLLYDPIKRNIKRRKLVGDKTEIKQVTGFKDSDDAGLQLPTVDLAPLFDYMGKNKRVDMGSKQGQDFLGEVLRAVNCFKKLEEHDINRLTTKFFRNNTAFNNKFPNFMDQLVTIPAKFDSGRCEQMPQKIEKLEVLKKCAGIVIEDWLEFMNLNSPLKIRTVFDIQLLIQDEQLSLFVQLPDKTDENTANFGRQLKEATIYIIRELNPAFKFFMLRVVGSDLKKDFNGSKKAKTMTNVDDAIQEILQKNVQIVILLNVEDKNQVKKIFSEFNQKVSDLDLSQTEREYISESEMLKSISLVANFADKSPNRWFYLSNRYKVEQLTERKELGVRAEISPKLVPIFRQLYWTIALTYVSPSVTFKVQIPFMSELNTLDFSQLVFPIQQERVELNGERLVDFMLTLGLIQDWEKLLRAKKNDLKERTTFLGCTYFALNNMRKFGVVDAAFEKAVSESMRTVFEDEFAGDTSRRMCDFFFEIVKISSTQKFCDLHSWFFDVIGENVRSIIANKVSELVYESCKTNSVENIQWALDFSKKVGTLEEQMGKIYSDDNTLLTLICRKKDADSKALEILLHAGFPEEFLLYKVEGKNALVWAKESGNSKVEQVLLGTDERKRIFEKPEKEQEIRDELIQLERELASKSPEFKQLVTEIEQLQKDIPNCWTDSLSSKSTSLLELLIDIQQQLKLRKLISQQPKEISDTILASFARLQKLHGFLRVKAKVLKEQQKVGELKLTKGEEKHFTKVLESVENEITRLRTDLSQ